MREQEQEQDTQFNKRKKFDVDDYQIQKIQIPIISQSNLNGFGTIKM